MNSVQYVVQKILLHPAQDDPLRMDFRRFLLDEMDFEKHQKENFDFFQVALMCQFFLSQVVLEVCFVYEKLLLVMLKTSYPDRVTHSLVISQYEIRTACHLVVLLALEYFLEYLK